MDLLARCGRDVLRHRFWKWLGLLGVLLLQGCISYDYKRTEDTLIVDGEQLRLISNQEYVELDDRFLHRRYETVASQVEVYLLPLNSEADVVLAPVAVLPNEKWFAVYHPNTKSLTSGGALVGQGRDGYVVEVQDEVFEHHLFNGQHCQVDVRGWQASWKEDRENRLSHDGRSLALLKYRQDLVTDSARQIPYEVKLYQNCQLVEQFTFDRAQHQTELRLFNLLELFNSQFYKEGDQFAEYGLTNAELAQLFTEPGAVAWDKPRAKLYWLRYTADNQGVLYKLDLKTKQLSTVGVTLHPPKMRRKK